jgi:TorA maturation chaperone TorD
MNPGLTATDPHLSQMFWRCLAKAYLPPRDEQFRRALREDWPAILRDIGGSIGLSFLSDIDAIAGALRDSGDSEALLVTYSRLFLVPPVAAPLNLDRYLKTAAFGGALALEQLYRGYGLQPSSDTLRDTPDHLARVLEFLGYLSARTDAADGAAPERTPRDDRRVLRTRFLLKALPELTRRCADGETWYKLPRLYSRILSFTLAAVRDHDGALFEERTSRNEEGQVNAPDPAETADLAACCQCGAPIISAQELQVIADRLRLAGLPVDHLRLCPDCRDAGHGWQSGRFVPDLPGFR